MLSSVPIMLSEETGRTLIDEIKHRELRRFNTGSVNTLNHEIEYIKMKIDELKRQAEQSEVTEELSINFALLKANKERHERIMKAYRLSRILKIQDCYLARENVSELMTPEEQEFMKEFDSSVKECLGDVKYTRACDRAPPMDFFVQVFTLEDCGTVLCGEDFVELKKDRIYFLKRADIMHLLKKNLVKIL